MRLVLRVTRGLEKSRQVRAYTKRDPQTGKLVYVREHLDRRNPAQLSLLPGRPALVLTANKPLSIRQLKAAAQRGMPYRQLVLPIRTPDEDDLFAWAARERERAAKARVAVEAHHPAEPISLADRNVKILADLLEPKGIVVRRGTTESGQPAIELTGNTFRHIEHFRRIRENRGGDGYRIVFGKKNHRGHFSWWTTDDHVEAVITAWGGTPYGPTQLTTPNTGRYDSGGDVVAGTRSGLDRPGALPAGTSTVRGRDPEAASNRQHDALLREGGGGWIGVDLDGTLAQYDGWKGFGHIGEPIRPMVKKVREALAQGREVRIFTARAELREGRDAVQKWLRQHGLPALRVTNRKDSQMAELWDDRARQVQRNAGEFVA